MQKTEAQIRNEAITHAMLMYQLAITAALNDAPDMFVPGLQHALTLVHALSAGPIAADAINKARGVGIKE